MLSAHRSLTRNVSAGKPLPRLPELEALYAKGTIPRHGEVIMIAGRSGTQKSGFALWLCDRLDLPTLYFSADMSAFTASSRIASTRLGLTTDDVEKVMSAPEGDMKRMFLEESLKESNITFSFDSPITMESIDNNLDAYLELFDQYPKVIVFDNLMDFEDAEADYSVQMNVMSRATELARDTGANVLILHHASDKSWDATKNPYQPPARNEIKNGMGEKPELVLGVAVDPAGYYKIATLKQRMGPCDPTGRDFATLEIDPATTSFYAKGTLAKKERGNGAGIQTP